MLTNKELYANVKKPTNNRDNKVKWITLVWTCTENEKNIIPKILLNMNLGRTRLRGRPRNRWRDEVREGGRIIVGEEWQEKVHNREE